MWLYIPNVGKPVRITSLQSVTGGVFNNADILRVDYTEEYEVTAATEEAGTLPARPEGQDRRRGLRPAEDDGGQEDACCPR